MPALVKDTTCTSFVDGQTTEVELTSGTVVKIVGMNKDGVGIQYEVDEVKRRGLITDLDAFAKEDLEPNPPYPVSER